MLNKLVETWRQLAGELLPFLTSHCNNMQGNAGKTTLLSPLLLFFLARGLGALLGMTLHVMQVTTGLERQRICWATSVRKLARLAAKATRAPSLLLANPEPNQPRWIPPVPSGWPDHLSPQCLSHSSCTLLYCTTYSATALSCLHLSH